MASERTKALLLEHEAFAELDVADQRARIVEYVADWYNPEHKLNTVDNVRFTQRLRTHAAKACISPGEALEIILPAARKQHATSVYEAEARRIEEEDQQTERGAEATPGPMSEPETDQAPEPVTKAPRGRKPGSVTAK